MSFKKTYELKKIVFCCKWDYEEIDQYFFIFKINSNILGEKGEDPESDPWEQLITDPGGSRSRSGTLLIVQKTNKTSLICIIIF